MVILEDDPNSLKSRMKVSLKRAVFRPPRKKEEKTPRNRKRCGYLGDDERAELEKLKRTFSPPPRHKPYPLIISHQSEENLHHMSDIGSAGSSHSSGFNETMFETLRSEPSFDIDSPMPSENGFMMRDDAAFRRSTSSVFEGVGGVDTNDTWDVKDQKELISTLTHRNKIITEERKDLQVQLETQEEILDKMDCDVQRLKKANILITKQKNEEGGRMKLENKELEYSTILLREQRHDIEHKLALMEKDRDAIKMQLDEVKLQLQQALDEHNVQKERHNELVRHIEEKELQMYLLEDGYKQESQETMATRYRLEELLHDNEEMRMLIRKQKTDKEWLASNLTKVNCELSRLQRGVPLSPTVSISSSITSPVSANCALLQNITVEENGEAMCDLFKEQERTALNDTENVELLNQRIDSVLNEREELQETVDMLQERNEKLEDELNSLQKLMCVVAPQHYIDDDAVQSVHISYSSFAGDVVRTIGETSDIQEEGRHPSSDGPEQTGSQPSFDDDDSGVVSHASTTEHDVGQCGSCQLWYPEKQILMKQVVSLQQEALCRNTRSTPCNWMLGSLFSFLLLLLLSVAYLQYFSSKCTNHVTSWTEFFAFRAKHPTSRHYTTPF